MPFLLRVAILALVLLIAALALTPEARAHGGTYRGPGAGLGPGAAGPGVPTGPGPGGGASPSTGGSAAADLTGWQLWWGLNREPYLALRTVLAQGGAGNRTTGSREAPAGPAGRPTDAQVRERIVPALLAALRQERNPDIATAALLALAKCGPRLEPAAKTEVATALRARLGDANQEVTETAAIALGVLARAGDLALLGDLLADASPGRAACGKELVPTRTRAYAAYALGIAGERIDNEDTRRWIVHRLVGALGEPDAAQRDVPVAALVALGLVPLVSHAPAPNGDGELAPTSSSAGLYDHVADWFADPGRDTQVRAYAPVTLARLANRAGEERRAACVGILARALETGSSESAVVRQSCVLGLGLVADGDGDAHDVRARALLKLASTEGDRLARRFAWISLAKVGARRGTEGRTALGETRPYLAGLLARGSTPERPWLSLALGVGERATLDSGGTASSGVHDALRKAIAEHTSPGEAGAHFLGFALSGAPAAGAVLLERVLELADDDARADGCLALGLARTTAAIEPLRRIVLESRYKPRLLREASIALGLLGDRSLTPQLVEMLRDSRGLSALSAVATALGFIGDERAVEPLLAIAADSARDASARAFAIVALGILGDPAPMPWNTPIALDVNWWLPPATLFDPATGTGVLDLL
ncbi:MAG: HEAT repeat domain-containing protein [Planctomycetota bacterium]|nr:HEAT repeat domain-containing protein [Planctomycetota bacterium]